MPHSGPVHSIRQQAKSNTPRTQNLKQVLQSLKDGKTEVASVPCPGVGKGQVLIRTSRTLVSAGTERMLVDFGKANILEKARQQPDKVRMVLEKIRTDGLAPTVNAVLNKLDQPLPMGYCNAGIVMDVGADVCGFAKGDRVVCNGKHAEVVSAPMNLCAKIPDTVSDDEAAFTVIGAIALQGIRLVQPTLGEAVVVTGLGLIGLMTVQLLRAHGCRVLGGDFDPKRLALARRFGAEVVDASGEEVVRAADRFSRGRGADAVIITASTRSNEPVHQAALMCRKRARIVLVGVTGLELSRADFYEKELSFQVSCSYGPGRYDVNYEEKGQDYPVGFVRWTEQRNFEAVLDMMSDGRLEVKPLISHRFPIDEAVAAYALVSGREPSLGILLEYPDRGEVRDEALRRPTVRIRPLTEPSSAAAGRETRPTVAFIGAGNYANAVLIPAFKAAGVRLKSVASQGGVSGVHAARKFGFEEARTDTDGLFADRDIDAVVITTRHSDHARLVCRALEAGKHVFVEKPLALRLGELAEIEQAYGRLMPQESGEDRTGESQDPSPATQRPSGERARRCVLMVGFNRRFAPQVQKIKSLLNVVKEPKAFVMTVNAGAIPPNHWTQDRTVGGGRIIGEACHFIDLLRFLAGAPIVRCRSNGMDSLSGDTLNIDLKFTDGSIGTVHYFANGTKSFAKERLEVFAGGRVLQLDNFRRLAGFGWPRFRRMNLWWQDKGQRACAAAFVRALNEGTDAPIPFEELIEVSRATIEVSQAAS